MTPSPRLCVCACALQRQQQGVLHRALRHKLRLMPGPPSMFLCLLCAAAAAAAGITPSARRRQPVFSLSETYSRPTLNVSVLALRCSGSSRGHRAERTEKTVRLQSPRGSLVLKTSYSPTRPDPEQIQQKKLRPDP